MAIRRLALLSLALCLLLKLPGLAAPSVEQDEIVYWRLAQHLANGEPYSLHGDTLPAALAPGVYDRPLFHHPPLLPILLAPFAALDAPRAAKVVGWIGHFLLIFAMAIWLDTRQRTQRPVPVPKALALLFVTLAVDPVFTFVSGKLWIDGLMAGLVALSYALVDRAAAVDGRRVFYLVAGGLALGLAGLAKVPALMVGPVLALRLAAPDGAPPKAVLRDVSIVATAAAAVVAPWFIGFFSEYGVWLPYWMAGEELRGASRFVALSLDRPWWYFFAKLSVAEPFFAGLLTAVMWRPRRIAEQPALWLWLVVFTVVPTLQGVAGYGFQTRFVAAAVPPILMLACADLVPSFERRFASLTVPLLVALLAWLALNAAPFVISSRIDEMLTLPELVYLSLRP